MYICIYIYIYIYMYRERERERERKSFTTPFLEIILFGFTFEDSSEPENL